MKHNKYRLLYSSALVLSPLMNGTLGDVADTDEQSHYADRYGTDAQGQDSIISAIESNNAELRDTVRKTVQRIIQLDGISTKAIDTLHNIIIAGITGSIAGIKDLEELHATGDTEPADLLSFLQQLQAWLTGSYPQNASQALSTLKSQIAVQYPSWNIPMLPPETPTDNVETIHRIGQFETEYGTGMNLPISSNLNEFIGKNVTFKLVNQDTKEKIDRFDYAVKLDGIKRYTEEGVIVLPNNNEIRILDLAAGNYTLDITGGTKTDRYDLVVHPKKIEVNLEAEGKIYTGTTDAVLRVTSSGILKRDVKDVHVIARGTFPSAQKGDYEVSVNDYRLEGAKRHNYILLPWSGQLNTSILKRSHNSGNPNPPQNTSIYVTMNAIPSSTNNQPPTITGTGKVGTTVEVIISRDTIPIQTISTIVDQDGKWSITPSALKAGRYKVSATATDAAGNTATATTQSFMIRIAVDAINGNNIINADEAITITGTYEEGGTVEVTLLQEDGSSVPMDPVTVDSDGTWSSTVPADTLTTDGPYTIRVTIKDAAGNTTTVTQTFTVDSSPPTVTMNVSSPTNDPTPTITGRGESDATVEVTLNGTLCYTTTVGSDGNWRFTPDNPLIDGTYTISATARDAAGNTTTVTETFRVDSSPPTVTMNVSSPTNDLTPTITGAGEAGTTVEVTLLAEDGSFIQTSVTVESDETWRVTPDNPLTDGTYTISATARDAAGNTTTVTEILVVDTTTYVTINTIPSPTNDLTPTITGAGESDATVEVTLNGTLCYTTTVGSDENWRFTPDNTLSAGTYTVEATDAAKNTATETFTIPIVINSFSIVDTTGTVETNLPTGQVLELYSSGNPNHGSDIDGTYTFTVTSGAATDDYYVDVSAVTVNGANDIWLGSTLTQVMAKASATPTLHVMSGHSGLTALRLVGTDTTIPVWATDGSLTVDSGATLDLSGMTGLGSSVDLTGISSDITGLVINAGVEPTNIPNSLTSLKLTGSDLLPDWATDGSLTVESGATLDLSAMTGLGTSFSFATITNAEIKTVILPNSISTTSDTSGWSQDSGTPTTWTRP